MIAVDLIKKVYIDPIRSVIVVDDEYPTVSELLDGAIKKRPEDIDRLKEVITMCRDTSNSWTLDIDNGKSNMLDNFSRLSHSDLLILDYHLEGNGDDGKGEKALNIIDELTKNQHFNLVVVHTKGYKTDGQASGDFQSVFIDILLRLFGGRTYPTFSGYSESDVENALDEWSDEIPNILGDLQSAITTLDFLKIVKKNIDDNEAIEYQQLKVIYDTRPLSDDCLKDLSFESLRQYVIGLKQKELKGEFGEDTVIGLNWCNERLWIKTNNAFIIVVGKNVPVSELPEKLLESLQSWNPHPHALLLSRFRHLVDEYGFSYVDNLINKKYVQAGWLKDFLKPDDLNAKWIAQQTSERLLSSMSEQMMSEMESYACSIRTSLLERSTLNAILLRYHNLDISNKVVSLEIVKNINAYACSKPVTGNQLTTGHIIEFEDNKYVCLTPACDLVPTQLNDWKRKLGTLMPFKLVKLWKSEERYVSSKKMSSDEKLLTKLNSNEHIVFDDQGIIKCYSLLKSDGANPQWEQVFAHSAGLLNWNEGIPSITLTQIDSIDNNVGSKVVVAKIVTQLRYEYAINLLQRFGFAQSRVGLDFTEYR